MYEQWLAACVDCDGSIQYQGTSSFSQNYKEMVDIFEERTNALGCRTRRTELPQYTVSGHTTQYYVTISGTYEETGIKDKLIFLKAILPFLIRKRKIALSAIKYLERQVRLAPPQPEHKFEEIMIPDKEYTTSELAKMQNLDRPRTWFLLIRLLRKGVVVKRQLAPAPSPSLWTLKGDDVE